MPKKKKAAAVRKKSAVVVRKTPVRFSPAIVEDVCEKIAGGKSLVEVCRQPGMPSRSQFHQWLVDNKDAADRYARAREDQADTLADEIVRIADTDDDPVRARVRVDARKWVAAKLKPKRYGDAVNVNLEATVSVAARVTEQLRRARERLIQYGEVIDVEAKESAGGAGGEDDDS